jgi:hypothetical protein
MDKNNEEKKDNEDADEGRLSNALRFEDYDLDKIDDI